jgi:hypothetical protein
MPAEEGWEKSLPPALAVAVIIGAAKDELNERFAEFPAALPPLLPDGLEMLPASEVKLLPFQNAVLKLPKY